MAVFKPPDTPGEPRQLIFESMPVASFQVGSLPAAFFPIVGELTEEGGQRIVRHVRPYRDGAKLDSTGATEIEFNVLALFNNSIRESGLEANNRALYPFVLRAIVDAFKARQTGTLTLPTVGRVRARAEKYRRSENVGARDEATLQLTFVSDNEDAVSAATFQLPTVRASMLKQASQTLFSASREGAHDADLVSLFQLATEIEAALLAPGRSVADLQSQVNRARSALGRIARAQEQLADDVGLAASEPRGSEFFRNLTRLLDTQARAADEKFASRPRTKAFVVDVVRTNLFEIAARFKQDAAELLDLNSERLADPMHLEEGDVVRVFETGAV